MPPHVVADAFISYVEEDSALAADIARGLGEAGATAWRYENDAISGRKRGVAPAGNNP